MCFALVIKRKFGKLCDKSLLHKNTPKLSREVLGEPERQIINRCYQEESFGGHQTPETPHDLHNYCKKCPESNQTRSADRRGNSPLKNLNLRFRFKYLFQRLY